MLERAIRAALADLRLNLLSVFSVAVAFVCLSATLLVFVNIDAVKRRYAETGQASVYLKAGVDEKTISEVEKALLQAPGVKAVRYVSSDTARREVLNTTSDDALARLPEEAFPSSLEVTLTHSDAQNRARELKTLLEQLPAVEGVETYRSWTDRLEKLLRGGVIAAAILALVVLGAVVSVVGSTMRMALSRRSTEVEVLKMVGATDDYVRGPFVVEGALQGGFGALAAVLLLGMLYLVTHEAFDSALGSLFGVNLQFLPFLFVLGLVLLGSGLGALSALLSMRRLMGNYA
jgi:cell division transport system permease protein